MMKKLLMFCTVFMAGTAMMMAQFPSIGILGGSTTVGWDINNSIQMATTDGINYTYGGLVVTVPGTDGGVKFVQGASWDVNWGSAGFPTGTGTQNGANIPATNGTWNVTLNITTGAYSFVPAGVSFNTVALVGGGATATLSTTDGISYSLSGTSFAAGTYYFTQNGSGQWGGAGFPAGTAASGSTINVPVGYYTVTFNSTTAAYAFSVPVVSLVGSALDPDWAIDVDLVSTDGINYSKQGVVIGTGELKFRQSHGWDVNWGAADFPAGTGTQNGANILVATAGTYDVTFNRSGAYSFTVPTSGIQDFTAVTVVAYPNPSGSIFNFDAGTAVISTVQITDVSGKVILSKNAGGSQVVVDASGLAGGIYFARVNAGEASKTIRVVKN